MSPSVVEPGLIHLFLKEAVYVLPEDMPAAVREPMPIAKPAATPVAQAAPVLPLLPKAPAPAKPAPTVETPTNPYALPKLLPRSLAILVHQPEGTLDPALTEMLGKLATATEPDQSLHVVLAGDMSKYAFPAGWHPWAARLTLLLGWPQALLARHRIADTFKPLRFASAHLIAAPHPVELEANRALKAQLWKLIQAVKS